MNERPPLPFWRVALTWLTVGFLVIFFGVFLVEAVRAPDGRLLGLLTISGLLTLCYVPVPLLLWWLGSPRTGGSSANRRFPRLDGFCLREVAVSMIVGLVVSRVYSLAGGERYTLLHLALWHGSGFLAGFVVYPLIRARLARRVAGNR